MTERLGGSLQNCLTWVRIPLSPNYRRFNLISLDLHGCTHEDAKRETIRFIEGNWDSLDDLEIITGHSSKMKNIVKYILDEYKLIYADIDLLDTKIRFWTWTEEV